MKVRLYPSKYMLIFPQWSFGHRIASEDTTIGYPIVLFFCFAHVFIYYHYYFCSFYHYCIVQRLWKVSCYNITNIFVLCFFTNLYVQFFHIEALELSFFQAFFTLLHQPPFYSTLLLLLTTFSETKLFIYWILLFNNDSDGSWVGTRSKKWK